MVLGLLCLALLVLLLFMKSSLGSDADDPNSTYSTYSRVARKLVWTVATSEYLCGCDCVYISVCIYKDKEQ